MEPQRPHGVCQPPKLPEGRCATDRRAAVYPSTDGRCAEKEKGTGSPKQHHVFVCLLLVRFFQRQWHPYDEIAQATTTKNHGPTLIL